MESGQMLGRYQLLRCLGRGGMGEVWQAVDTGITHREVAIKVVRTEEDLVQMDVLAGEARTIARLPHHPNVVILHHVLEMGSMLALVMEHIPGLTLRDLLEAFPRGLPWSYVHIVLHGLLEGMAHAHRHGVIHRDLKPENVRILSTNGERPIHPLDIKILDFGLARAERQAAIRFTTSAAGTLDYMSPEQFMEQPQGPFSDVYALGVMAFEMITARTPFWNTGDTGFASCLKAHCQEAPPPASRFRMDCPSGLDEILHQALAKQPGNRFPDAEAFARAILPVTYQLALPPMPIQAPVTNDAATLLQSPVIPLRPCPPTTNPDEGSPWLIGLLLVLAAFVLLASILVLFLFRKDIQRIFKSGTPGQAQRLHSLPQKSSVSQEPSNGCGKLPPKLSLSLKPL